eukprot:6925241-Prymnesium_polylepis.1
MFQDCLHRLERRKNFASACATSHVSRSEVRRLGLPRRVSHRLRFDPVQRPRRFGQDKISGRIRVPAYPAMKALTTFG